MAAPESRRAAAYSRARQARGAGLWGLGLAAVAALLIAVGWWGAAAAPKSEPTSGRSVLAAAGAQPGVQLVPGDQPAVAVFGTGEASAPAESGTIQMIVRAVDPFAAGQVMPPSGQPPALTEAQVAPVAAAIVAAGADAASVEVVIGAGFGGPFGPGAAQVLIELEGTALEQAAELVAAGTAAAGANGLYVESVGAGFEVSDCAGLIQAARQEAAADGRMRAQGLADVLGLRLGEVVLAAESPTYDGGGFGCSAAPAVPGGKGAYFPPFDPTTEAVVEVYSQLNLAYGIG